MIRFKIKQYAKLKDEIGAYFGTDIYDGFDDMTDSVKWTINDGVIQWSENIENSDIDDYEYSGEIYGTSVWEKKDYTLIRWDNSCGNLVYGIFDNSKRVYE